MKKLIILLLIIVTICNQQISIFAQTTTDHVIFSVEPVSDSSAYVSLSWSNPSIKTPIMIVSWSVDSKKIVTVKYQQGLKVVAGFNKRLISGDGIQFPTIIILEEELGQGVVSKPAFSDLPQTTEPKLAIQFLYDKGIINGYPDGSFKPIGQVTRAEFTKMLFLAGEMTAEQKPKISFTDVSSSHWAKEYILTLATKGIVNGIGNNKFNPSGTITMGEVLAIIDRSFTLEDKGVSYPYTLQAHWSNENFTDLVSKKIVLSADSYYKPYIPTMIATRADCAVLLSRVLKTYYTSK